MPMNTSMAGLPAVMSNTTFSQAGRLRQAKRRGVLVGVFLVIRGSSSANMKHVCEHEMRINVCY